MATYRLQTLLVVFVILHFAAVADGQRGAAGPTCIPSSIPHCNAEPDNNECTCGNCDQVPSPSPAIQTSTHPCTRRNITTTRAPGARERQTRKQISNTLITHELQWYGCVFDDALAACVQNRKTDLYLESLPAGSAENLCNVEPDKCTTDVPPKLKAYQCVNYHPRDCVEKSKDLVFFPGEAITDYFDCVKLTCSKCIHSQVQLLTPMHAVDSQPRAKITCKHRLCVAGVRDTPAQRMYVCHGN